MTLVVPQVATGPFSVQRPWAVVVQLVSAVLCEKRPATRTPATAAPG